MNNKQDKGAGMKMMIMAIVVAMASVSARAEGLGRVEVRPDGNGGAEMTAGVDVLALRRNSAIADAAWYAKPFVATKEIAISTVETVREHPGKTLFGTFVGLVGIRAAQGKLGDDVDRLRGKSTTSGSGGNVGRDVSHASTQSLLLVDVSGSHNNITIVNQQPQGSQPAANANSGSGGVTAL